MKVSIIIPVYNVYPYLRECVESVKKMKTDTQIILVDDGSSDNSGLLCDELAREESRIVVIHQENGGLSAARNTGIKHSTGDYIMFLDSDDFLDPEISDQMFSALGNEPDILVGLYQKYYADQQRYEKESCDGFLGIEGLMHVDRFLEAIPADGRSCYMVAVRFVVRRSFLLKNNLFFETGIYHEDEEWTQRLLCSAEHVFVSHSYFYQYRQAREGAITSIVKPKHIRDTFTVMEHTTSLIDQQMHLSSKAQYLQKRRAQMFLSNMISVRVLTGEERKTAYQKLMQFKPLCQEHLCGTIGSCAKIALKVAGIRITCGLLRVARRLVKAG